VEFREKVKPRAAYAGQTYWRKPVPGFGDIDGRLLVLGIAPALHGGNRTGRPFTGDDSGRFLVRALYETGFASQSISEDRDDGLFYRDCYLTAAVKCAPPGDRPLPSEFDNCSRYLDAEISLMKNLRVVLALGALSFRAFLEHVDRDGKRTRGIRFGHGISHRLGDLTLYGSYHPSPRNTNTGKLTLPMLVDVLFAIKGELRRR